MRGAAIFWTPAVTVIRVADQPASTPSNRLAEDRGRVESLSGFETSVRARNRVHPARPESAHQAGACAISSATAPETAATAMTIAPTACPKRRF